MFQHVVTTERELRALLGHPHERAVQKDLGRLDANARAFIAHAPFLLLATAGADGRCDVSPKGDAPGFVRVLDDTHLVIPDRPGNKRLDGMTNLLANPHVGLIFLVPGKEDTLRVNGRACVVRDEALLTSLEAMGKRPDLAIGVEVEECYLHCPKAFRRSKLWEPESWTGARALPSMARARWEQQPVPGRTLEEYERESEEGLRRTMY
ncbi:MAG: phosphohydrolase [Candidatus Rokubacteria bacterium RIFCSPHIGHO2_12_FULL_73_22]|nr:MAG: phosphohydrolase [Candidatus Rokubacteria bacterium RIFCSPHIGHO2_12_FULL_73_22]OGL01847.1 MAG: phosphohydrolase [Candidatus Rokubacteria bacterium RIFCSPHIGHO2_02_FULL_73_26]OGL07985.1 MAG: phosphohydrolase [Candidatus Rokubacteria bacterium RIFCSPLOWO2_02_FULL_73_56]OGL24956.1 MAG: phosphohydrolase [Candidatus Rokubacteria bacterium RIFCSPLOWO2_12_FULL_73_47]